MKDFEKGEILTAERLNELIREAARQDLREVVQAPAAKIAQHGPARFNCDVVGADGEGYALPDYLGLIGAIESAVIKKPVIDRGRIKIPLAQSNECMGSVPGLLQGVRVDAETPYVENGILHLVPGKNGEGDGIIWPQLSIEASADEQWRTDGWHLYVGLADECSGTAGVIKEVRSGSSLSLNRGVLTVPVDECSGMVGVAGVVNVAGNAVAWADMVNAPVRLATIFEYETGVLLYLTGQIIDGFLKFDTELR